MDQEYLCSGAASARSSIPNYEAIFGHFSRGNAKINKTGGPSSKLAKTPAWDRPPNPQMRGFSQFKAWVTGSKARFFTGSGQENRPQRAAPTPPPTRMVS
eukprot:2411661-Amphidinium_carterae.1